VPISDKGGDPRAHELCHGSAILFCENYAVMAGYSIMNKTGLGMQIIDSTGVLAILRRQHKTTQ